MKATLISDLHGNLVDLSKYPSDILIISGDLCPTQDHSIGFQILWMNDNFASWIRRQKEYFTKIIYICGNHDFWGMENRYRVNIEQATHLLDDWTEFDGLKIYGSPWSNWFHDWAFNAYEDELEKIYSKIPDGTDIIISHGPPRGYGDEVPISRKDKRKERIGSTSLIDCIDRCRPKLLVCGHNHEGYGVYEHGETVIVNASLLNDDYKVVHEPIIVEI